ncbi:MAG: right-handed parallel beta-helix repeat-containing protein [Rudaea sp.]
MRTERVIQHFVAGLLILFATSTAFAQATRTWVSGVGDDANPCSRTAPCKTFAGAISKTAPGGTIDALDPGGFGALTITKAITLEAVGSVASVLVSGTNGIVVAAQPTDQVIIRGLTIEGLGTGINGINFVSGGQLVIERCVIQAFTSSGINLATPTASQLVVTDTTIDKTSSSGPAVYVQATGSAPSVTLDRVRVVGNGGYGVLVKNGIVAIRHSTLNQNYYGVRAISSLATAQVTLDDSIVSGNTGVGVSAVGSTASVVISRSTITGNGSGVSGSVTSFGDNRIFNNNGNDGSPVGGSIPLK